MGPFKKLTKHLIAVDLNDAFGFIMPEALNSRAGPGGTSAPRVKELPRQSGAADVSRRSRLPANGIAGYAESGEAGKKRRRDCETHSER